MISGIIIILIFLAFAGLMMTRRLPALLALPAMALSVGAVSGLFYAWPAGSPGFSAFIFDTILTQGAVKLSQAIMFTVFGSVLSQVIIRAGIASRLIGLTAEYAGKHRMLLTLMLTVVTAVCFTSVTGLGAVIMIGTLILPILIGSGLSPVFSCGLMLFAISLGGVFNPAILGFYMDVLQLPQETVQYYVVWYGGLLAVTTLVYMIAGGWRERNNFCWAEIDPVPQKKVPALSLITPIIPIALILAGGVPIIPAFIAGILWGVLTAEPLKAVSNLTAAMLEGMKDAAPVLGLFIGLGMCLNAMTADPTKEVMAPLLAAVLPQQQWSFVLFFLVLAPLALYRGPLNMYGLGAGVAGIILGSSLLAPTAVMAAFFSVGQMQGVCDPTNTHNVWLAQFAKTSTEQLLKSTLPYVWGFVAAALVWSVYFAGALHA